MSPQFPEAEVYKELGAIILCHDIRHSYRNKNKIAGSKLYRDIIKVYHEKIQEKAQRTGHDRKLQATIEAVIKTKDSITTELSISRQSDQFGPKILGSTTLS